MDELVETLQDLDPEGRRELSSRVQTDWYQRVRDAQRAYLDRLEEEGLLGQRGDDGGTFQPIPGEEGEWIEYCREHPNDPICLAGAVPPVGDRLSDFLDVRAEYLSHLEEEGLLDVESSITGRGIGERLRTTGHMGNPSPQPSLGGGGSPVGFTPPPDPPWPWPWPGPRPDPGPLFEGDPIPFPANRYFRRNPRSGAFDQGDPVPLPTSRRFRRTLHPGAFDPRMSGVGAAGSPVGLTPPPDPPWPWPWPPEWPPEPWPWPGPRPDPFPFGGHPIPVPASPRQRRW